MAIYAPFKCTRCLGRIILVLPETKKEKAKVKFIKGHCLKCLMEHTVELRPEDRRN